MKILDAAAAALLITLAPALAHADDAKAKCTSEPKTSWMSEKDIMAKAEAAGFLEARRVKVAGTCYEVYAKTKAGKKAEVFMNPVTGDVVKTEID
jgi:hypothetical protein